MTKKFEITVERAEEIARLLTEQAKTPPKKAKLSRSDAVAYWHEPIREMLAAGYTITMISEELTRLNAPVSAVTLGKGVRSKIREKPKRKKQEVKPQSIPEVSDKSDSTDEPSIKSSSEPEVAPTKANLPRSRGGGAATTDMLSDEF